MYCVILICSLLLLGSRAFATHGSWQDHYQDAAGIPCCGVRDCQQVPGRLLDRHDARVQVEVQSVVVWLPERSVHASEDGAFWVCLRHGNEASAPLTASQIRCVFLATGG